MKQPSLSSTAAERGRPRDPKIDRALLRTARRHLFEYGYAAASIDNIAKDAQVSKAAIYRRWSSKAEFLADACASLRD